MVITSIKKVYCFFCLFLRKCTVVPEERIPLFRSKYTVRPEQDTACIILASASLLA